MYGTGIPGGVEEISPRLKGLYQTGHKCIVFNYSNRFNTVRRTEVLQVIGRARELAAFIAKCYMEGRSPTFSVWLPPSGEPVRIRSETGADEGDIMARIYFACLQTANAADRQQFESAGVDIITYTDDIEVVHAAPHRTTGHRGYPFLQVELIGMGVTVNGVKIFASPPPDHVLTKEEFTLLAKVGVGIAHGEGELVVRHPCPRAHQGVV